MVCPQCSAVVSVRKCAVTVAMKSYTTGKYKHRMIEKIYIYIYIYIYICTISADCMSKRAERASKSHEQIVSRM